jgi:endonuclease YncB( thermonuclease family)
VSFQARVVGVTDGDSLTVLDDRSQQLRVRLAEIDAPERGQPWGNRSREALSALVFGKTISVQQTDTDRYGRVVARVFAEGRDVNRTMVEQGAAWAYREYLTDETLIATEARARQGRTGLWSMSDQQTVAPWEWRRGQREGAADIAPPTAAARPQALFTPAPRPVVANSGERFSCSG